ncbi:arsenic transporter [Naasia aerilata]|uniref:Arsenic transporter n=1 Tax=Naasia aerilata TaxID=1162966 RepID=A0ABN6XM76_9MICO|nr:arsenic transporter [Naasia aerilata]
MVGAVLLVLGAVAAIVLGLPAEGLGVLADRVWPVLLFVVAITVVAELADAAGIFRVLAGQAARLGRGRALILWLLVAALATAGSVLLSLDTAAVLLTPVVVILARSVGLSPIPFALTTVWLANTASLLLPVSNLTNLLAAGLLPGNGSLAFASRTALPWAVCVAVPLLVLLVVYRRQLTQRYEPAYAPPPEDRTLFRIAAVVLAVLIPLLVSGIPVWIPALAAAVVLTLVFAVRRRDVLRPGLVPWALLLFASGLFLVVEVAHERGLTPIVRAVAGTGEDPLALLRLSATGALGANLLDNLPAYLAIEPAAESGRRLVALLIGVNAGPLITPWASLATLLWHSRLTSLGVSVSWPRYAALGLVVVPLTVVAATLVSALVP